jgi:hypothetical protein
VITPTQQLENYLESFSEFEKFVAGHAVPWLRKLRRHAFARFCEVGFPTTHDEDWRFTNVSAISQTPFQLARTGRARPSQQELEPYRVEGVACQLVFVNGRFAARAIVAGQTARWGEGQQSCRGDFQQSRSD